MIRIQRLFENHLDNPEISAEELRQFAEDHLGKLRVRAAAVPVVTVLAALLGPTEAAFGAFDTALSARTTLLAGQSGGTITKDEAVQLMRSTVRQREGRIRDALGEKSGPYAEFFPAGITEYTRARMGQVPGLLDRLVTVATKYQAQLGAALVAEFTALRTVFASARADQLGTKGEVAAARTSMAASRTALELQLGRNLLAIASLHLGQPDRAAEFFNQSLLEDPTRDRHSEDPAPPPPA